MGNLAFLSFIPFFNRMMTSQKYNHLIVGLGNPGRQYRQNRHNVGFMTMDRLAKRLGVQFSRLESMALVTKAEYQEVNILLAKPQTFMNLSGQAVSTLVRFYKIPTENLMVIYDDVDLPTETLRLRPSGGSAGQKGVASIIERLGTQEFPRLRIGIGRPPGRMPASAYVLQDFPTIDLELLEITLERAADAALIFISEGLEAAMNKYNG
jgi:PTH1 family peptidyl-tRNA hydrolase